MVNIQLNGSAVLETNNLSVSFSTVDGKVKALNNIDFVLHSGERVALLGESGCGKTVFALSIIGLLPDNALIEGQIYYDGSSLFDLSPRQWEELRGRDIVLLPQDPANALNPVLSIGYQMREMFPGNGSAKAKNKTALKDLLNSLLSSVGFSNPDTITCSYPFSLSGGMNQRAILALSSMASSILLLADEPTKGLDRVTCCHNLSLIDKFTRDKTMLLITHDIETAEICEKVAIMYAGTIVETGYREEVFTSPMHPYTRGLLNAHPERGLIPIPGNTPSLTELPSGCSFHPRCEMADTLCEKDLPPLYIKENYRFVRCHHVGS